MAAMHTIGLELPIGHGTVATFCQGVPEKLVVFVHGFGGSAQGTWKGFPERLEQDPAFKRTDFIYFGYKSRRQAQVSAQEFLELLMAVLGRRATSFTPSSLGRKSPPAYKKIVLVSHSLGALITRRALLMARQLNAPWLGRTRFLLFAPAHRGCNLIPLLTTCLPGAWKIGSLLIQFAIPVLQDLTPDSTALNDLERDTQAVIDAHADHNISIASEIIWAERETVVIAGNFCLDPLPILAYDQGHMSVCKPNADYLLPVDHVKEAL
jgi:pimeloyl-ACP methyl ester carboxylesterase